MEGEQGERSIEIRAWKMQRNRFHFCGTLKDAVSLLGGNCVLPDVKRRERGEKEKKLCSAQAFIHRILHAACLRPPICPRETTDALVKASWTDLLPLQTCPVQ